ncbi:MAG: hypothetical protein P1V97_33275, partial [Planctomycetota bacterium]|nr:hypothetical protein [Planctomycetota bacterium]
MAEDKIPVLDSNAQSAWRDAILRIIKPLSQKEVLYKIHKLEGAKKAGPGDEFYKKNKAVLSLFVKGDPEKLKLWFLGSSRPGINWLHRFAEVVRVTTDRLWAELKAASGGQKQVRKNEWHRAFSGIKAHEAWVEPRLLLPSELKRLGEPELSLSDLVAKLSPRVSRLSSKKTTNQADRRLKRLHILGPKGSGACALASHLATSFWRSLPQPGEEQPKKKQSRVFRRLQEPRPQENKKVVEASLRVRIVVVDAESDSELLNYGEGEATLEIIVQRPTNHSDRESTNSVAKKDELTIEVLPWTVTELRHLAARLSQLNSIEEKTRNALDLLGNTASGQAVDSGRLAPRDEEVGYAAEAIDLLAALANSDKPGSWDQKTYSAARAQRDWQIAARTPGAFVLGGIDQETAEKLLAALFSTPRQGDGSWTVECASAAISDVLDCWHPKDRLGVRDLVRELRDLKNNREEKALS